MVRAGKPRSNRLSSQRGSKCCHICAGNEPESLGTSKWHHDCCQHERGSGHATSSLHSLVPSSQALAAICLWARPRYCCQLCYGWKEGGSAVLSPKAGIRVQSSSEVQEGELVHRQHSLCFTELRKQAHQYRVECCGNPPLDNAATLLYHSCTTAANKLQQKWNFLIETHNFL